MQGELNGFINLLSQGKICGEAWSLLAALAVRKTKGRQ
jgi:hypothetical protein